MMKPACGRKTGSLALRYSDRWLAGFTELSGGAEEREGER
jgi:hypothetical protein